MNKKIVLYITSMHRGGAERVMSILANSFADDGEEVVLVTDVPVLADEDNYALRDSIKCVCLKPKSKTFALRNLERIKSLRKIIKNERADAVLSFLGRQNYRMLVATIGLKCRKCVSVRNDPNMEYGKTWLKRKIANILFGFADVCVFQTKDARKYFSKRIQKKSVIIINPIDDKFFKVNKAKNPKNIITVGRLESQKNHKLLIRAFSKISEQIGDEKLLIYGEGSLRGDLQDCIDKSGMTSRITLMGEASNIEKELAKAKMFVLSSDYEGMPNALMEAMAVGVPCISTDCPCGGPRELIKNGENGFLVPCGDTNEMSNCMLRIDDEDLDSIGENAKLSVKCYTTNEVFGRWRHVVFGGRG